MASRSTNNETGTVTLYRLACRPISEGQALAIQSHDYRRYRVVIRAYGRGWRATIYAPDSSQPILGPQSDDPTSQDDVLDRAKRLVDDLMN